MSIRTLRLALVALAVSYAACTTAQDDSMYLPCVTCHWEDGGGSQARGAPALSGLSATYLARQMRHFRDGTRGHSLKDLLGRQMSLIAAVYDDAAVDVVSAYAASLEATTFPATISGDQQAGEALWERCGVCHAADGTGNETLNSPSLIHLQDWYVLRQLQLYASGLRGDGDEYDAQMRAAIDGLKETDFRNLTAYVATLAASTASEKSEHD